MIARRKILGYSLEIDTKNATVKCNGQMVRRWCRSCRSVFKIDDTLVVKIDQGVGGRFRRQSWQTQCMYEGRIWDKYKADPEVGPYLGTVLDYGDGWLVMPFYEAANKHRSSWPRWAAEKVEDIRRRTRLYDLWEKNYLVTKNGELVIYDYGLGD